MIWIVLLALIIEIIFSPRLEITSQKDVLLFYKKDKYTRDYIVLFSLWAEVKENLF